MKVQITQLKLV